MNTMTTPSRDARHQRGATLIEVLVSFLIVSFGLLSLLALQNNAIKYNKTTELRALATLLATDLGERMRANPAAAELGLYDQRDVYTPMTAQPVRTPCHAAATQACATPDAMAAQDVSEWRRLLFQALPQADAHVRMDATTGLADIWLAWRDPTGGSEAVGDTDDAIRECPLDFVADGAQPAGLERPRCAYFSIAITSGG